MKTLFALLITAFLAWPAYGAERISVMDAFNKIEAGQMVLIDIREPGEWRQTGVAPQAETIAMRDPQFVSKLQSVIDANPDKTLGLICAAGGRSTAIARRLEAAGITNVVDIEEGMLGNRNGKGWIRNDLPIEPYKVD